MVAPKNALWLALLLAACGGETTSEDVAKQREKAAKSLEKAREESREALEMQTEYFEDRKRQALDTLENRLRVIDEKIDQLTEASATGPATGNEEVSQAVADLRAEREVLNSRLQEVRDADIEDYRKLRRGIDRAVDEVEASLQELEKDLPVAR